MRSLDAYEVHLQARLLRVRQARRLVRRLWRAVKAWLDRPWTRQRMAYR